MSLDNLVPINRAADESEEALQQRKELTRRIYDAILPLLGPDQAHELLHIFNARLEGVAKANLKAIVDQKCELCKGPMKIEDQGDDDHFYTSCVRCGYMDILKK